MTVLCFCTTLPLISYHGAWVQDHVLWNYQHKMAVISMQFMVIDSHSQKQQCYIPANYFWVKCVSFSSCHDRNFRTFPTIFWRLPNVAKNVRRCSEDFFNDDILVCCDKVKCLFGLFAGILNLIFLIIHVLKNNSSGFVSQAWEIVFDAWDWCL